MEHEYLFPLLCKVIEEDKEAFTELYNATSGKMYAIALKMLGEKSLAEEATQDAYIKIWHNAASYQTGKGTVLTWMISIVRYRALDIIRYHGVRKETPLADNHDTTNDNETDVVNQEERELHSCMNELESQQKQAIYLAYFGGLSHREVNIHMGQSLGTVKSWIRRGLLSLQRCLGI